MNCFPLTIGCLKVSDTHLIQILITFSILINELKSQNHIFFLLFFAINFACIKIVQEIMTSDMPYNGQPILQLLTYKRIVGECGERFRLLLSDGQYLHSFCVLAMQMNHLMVENKLTANSIIKVLSYRTPMVYKFGCDQRFVFCKFLITILFEKCISHSIIETSVFFIQK